MKERFYGTFYVKDDKKKQESANDIKEQKIQEIVFIRSFQGCCDKTQARLKKG